MDENIVSGDKDDGVQSLPEDYWDEGFQSLPEGELDSGVQSLEANENIVFSNKDNGVQSLPVDDLDEGVQCLPLDEDGLPGKQVPSLDGHEAMVPNFEPSSSMQRKKQRTKVDDLAIVIKGWNLANVIFI